MTIRDLINLEIFELVNPGEDIDRDITVPYCCDLMSIAMCKAPSGCAWVTVMGNINTLAVSVLADAACIVLAEGVDLDETAAVKAQTKGVCVFRTPMPVFDAALKLHELLHA